MGGRPDIARKAKIDANDGHRLAADVAGSDVALNPYQNARWSEYDAAFWRGYTCGDIPHPAPRKTASSL
jgi:hypothetical protein